MIFEGARIFFGTKFPQNRNFLQFGTAFVSQNRAMKVTIAGSNYIKSISGEGMILAKRKKQEKTGCEEASIFLKRRFPKAATLTKTEMASLPQKCKSVLLFLTQLTDNSSILCMGGYCEERTRKNGFLKKLEYFLAENISMRTRVD